MSALWLCRTCFSQRLLTERQAFLSLGHQAAKIIDPFLCFGVGGEVFERAVGLFESGQFFKDGDRRLSVETGRTGQPQAEGVGGTFMFAGVGFGEEFDAEFAQCSGGRIFRCAGLSGSAKDGAAEHSLQGVAFEDVGDLVGQNEGKLVGVAVAQIEHRTADKDKSPGRQNASDARLTSR